MRGRLSSRTGRSGRAQRDHYALLQSPTRSFCSEAGTLSVTAPTRRSSPSLWSRGYQARILYGSVNTCFKRGAAIGCCYFATAAHPCNWTRELFTGYIFLRRTTAARCDSISLFIHIVSEHSSRQLEVT